MPSAYTVCHRKIKYRVYYYVGPPRRVDRVENATVSSEWNVAGVAIRVDRASKAAVLSLVQCLSCPTHSTRDEGYIMKSRIILVIFFPRSTPLFSCVPSENGLIGPDPGIRHLVFLLSPQTWSIVCLYYFISLLIFFFYYRKSPLFSSRTRRWFQFSHIIRKASRQVFR